MEESDESGENEYGDEEEVDGEDLEEESQIDEDLEGEQVDDSESEQEEQKDIKKIYKAAKLNPVFYEDKSTKKARREELQSKKRLSNTGYVEELKKELYDLPEELH